MKRFLINVSTNWCGMDQTYRAEAEKAEDLDEIVDTLAYENFSSYSCERDIAEEYGFDSDNMTDEDWDSLWSQVDESEYYWGSAEEFKGDDEEWKSWGGEIHRA